MENVVYFYITFKYASYRAFSVNTLFQNRIEYIWEEICNFGGETAAVAEEGKVIFTGVKIIYNTTGRSIIINYDILFSF